MSLPMPVSDLADVFAYGLSGIFLLVVTVNLWSRDRTLRGLLADVRGELDQARKERAEAREETAREREVADSLRKEVARLRRVVSALIRVVADAGLPVPDGAHEFDEVDV